MKSLLPMLLLVVAFSAPALAQSTTQDVTVIVEEINAISVSSGSVSLTINAATAGSAPTPASDNTTTYAITTNAASKKITGQLSSDFTNGITLQIELSAPTGASSSQQTLSSVGAANLVTGLTRVAASALTITYTASATAAVAPNASTGGQQQTVQFTVTDS